MFNRLRTTRLYAWLSLQKLTVGLTSGELRAIRTTNGIQLTFFVILLLLVPQILIFEPPETHIFSMIMFAEIV
ncbi:MAG TPA: hypothetical protein PKD60_13610, partial [Turneriella sp.]|nr:hypothetical protein [Turneriella sp.]